MVVVGYGPGECVSLEVHVPLLLLCGEVAFATLEFSDSELSHRSVLTS